MALQPSVTYDIQLVGKVKTALFGGEGLFFATLRGPGKVWLQSLPLSRLADRIYKAAPQTGRRSEEGSILGGIGDLIDGRRASGGARVGDCTRRLGSWRRPGCRSLVRCLRLTSSTRPPSRPRIPGPVRP